MSNVYMVGSGALTLDIVEKIINENMTLNFSSSGTSSRNLNNTMCRTITLLLKYYLYICLL